MKFANIEQRIAYEASDLLTRGDLEGCMAKLQKLEEMRPSAASMALMAVVATQTEQYELAIEYCSEAIERDPDNADHRSQMGVIYMMMHQYDEALYYMKKAFALNSGSPKVLTNLGTLYIELNEPYAARFYLKRALLLQENLAEAHLNLAMAYFLTEEFHKAWPEYEFRFLTHAHTGYDNFAPDWALWRGEDLEGKTLYLRTEQGKGDTLKFCRYINFLRSLGANIILHCDNDIKPLLEIVFSDCKVISGPVKITYKVDYWCWLMSLGQFFTDIPIHTPYICAVPDENTVINTNKFKIGVAWHGNPEQKDDWKRSIFVDDVSDLIIKLNFLPYCEIFSLQYGEVPYGTTGFPMNSWWQTAQIVSQLDAVITVDTSIAHLAGAMNIPTAILLSQAASFHYPYKGDRTSWYPSAKLFRQKTLLDWSSPVDEALQWIKSLIKL